MNPGTPSRCRKKRVNSLTWIHMTGFILVFISFALTVVFFPSKVEFMCGFVWRCLAGRQRYAYIHVQSYPHTLQHTVNQNHWSKRWWKCNVISLMCFTPHVHTSHEICRLCMFVISRPCARMKVLTRSRRERKLVRGNLSPVKHYCWAVKLSGLAPVNTES